ncbi:hypothetical protein KSF_100120 [Reticulibacter mediterranei]|uniref:HdeD family acid-resistance protein n=1 Tax=Reticulibacter mediterranei TaxID=2778369 RepID=A0A8J3IXY1_9CHLR|nr:HdeD family acid-resistance protein [Reticulibacter mediterranei]GHO99964.1 hypothetical protein KSF_100120 [Reticulibacter mediterranei]
MERQRMSTSEELMHLPWWMVLLEGIAALIIGVLLLTSPGMTTLVLTQVLGFYWLIVGVLALVNLFVDHSLWGWKLCSGILGILAGLVIIRHPLWSTLFIPALVVLVLAVQSLIQGGIKIFEAFRGGGFGAVILGILNILLGVVLLSAPLMAAFVLPLVVGIFALIGGVAAIFGAFRLHNSALRASIQQTPT